MEIITGTLEFELNKDTAAAIGKFDGIHLGHQKLLEDILQKKTEGLAACVFTFDPSPAIFFGVSDKAELTTKEEKRKLFESMGVDILIEFPMTEKTAQMPPMAFVEEVLIKRMHTKYIAAGTDLSFGAKGAGNAALLDQVSSVYGFRVRTIEKLKKNGEEISSTLVRKCVEAGDMTGAQLLLGRPYSIVGKVIHGKALGRKMGMPTLNLQPDENKLLPPCGVYYSTVLYGGRMLPSITNIGYKPTVTKEHILGAETYLYDFDEEIYGEHIEVLLLAFKRPERKFSSLEELHAQTQMDLEEGKAYHLSKKC